MLDPPSEDQLLSSQSFLRGGDCSKIEESIDKIIDTEIAEQERS
jgi:hypothetical protein